MPTMRHLSIEFALVLFVLHISGSREGAAGDSSESNVGIGLEGWDLGVRDFGRGDGGSGSSVSSDPQDSSVKLAPAIRKMQEHWSNVVRKSTFALGSEGWYLSESPLLGRKAGRFGVKSGISGSKVGAEGPYPCHKYMCAKDDGDVRWYWAAPPSFVGDLSTAVRGRLMVSGGWFEVEKKDKLAPTDDAPNILLTTDSGVVLAAKVVRDPENFNFDWDITLTAEAGWQIVGGGPMTDLHFQEIAKNVTGLFIEGGCYKGREIAFLSTVKIVKSTYSDISINPAESIAGAGLVGGSSEVNAVSADPTEHIKEVETAKVKSLEEAVREQQQLVLTREEDQLSTEGEVLIRIDGSNRQDRGLAVSASKKKQLVDHEEERRIATEARAREIEEEVSSRRLGRARKQKQGADSNPSKQGQSAIEAKDIDEGEDGIQSQPVPGIHGLSCQGEADDDPLYLLGHLAKLRGLVLKQCLRSTDGALGLTRHSVLYTRHIEDKSVSSAKLEVVGLDQIESVATDERDHIVFLGPVVQEGEENPVLLRTASTMAEYNLDKMAEFFEIVQEAVAAYEQ